MTSDVDAGTGVRAISSMWWLWLVTGTLWVFVGLVILQFDSMSVATVGVVIAVMLLMAGLQYAFTATLVAGWRWLWFGFGGALVVSGIVALANPARTFTAIADMLGFIFAVVALIWLIEAFAVREDNPLWWLSLTAGVVMLFIAFWVDGQFLVTRAYTLLVFAGIWALMRGVLDVVAAFHIRSLGRITVR